MWKHCLKQTSENTNLLVVEDYYLITGLRIVILQKLNSKELYSVLIFAIDHQPTSQKYFNKLFPNTKLTWEKNYLNVRRVTVNSYLCCFHNKIVNNVLYLNKNLCEFGKNNTLLILLLYNCSNTNTLWNQLKLFITTDLDFNLITNDKKRNFLYVMYILYTMQLLFIFIHL